RTRYLAPREVMTFTARAPFRNCLLVFLRHATGIFPADKALGESFTSPRATVAVVPRIRAAVRHRDLRGPASYRQPAAATPAARARNRTPRRSGWFPAESADSRGRPAHPGDAGWQRTLAEVAMK